MVPLISMLTLQLSLWLTPAQAQIQVPDTKYAKVLKACGIATGDVQAEPFLSNGEVSGFRYTHVRPGSSYARSGFKAGDVLLEQNGVKMKTPDDVIKAFEAVAVGATQVSTIQRAGKSIVFKMKCSK